MKTEHVSVHKNHVTFTVSFTPQDVKGGGNSVPHAIEAMARESSRAILDDLGLVAAEQPEGKLSEDALAFTATVTCVPVICDAHYKGIALSRKESELPPEHLRELALDRVIEAVDFDLPQAMLEQEVEPLVTGLRQQMKYNLMGQGRMMNPFDEDFRASMLEFEAEAVRQVKANMVLNAILAAERFEITRGELEDEAQAVSAQQDMSVAFIKDFLGEDLSLLQRDIQIRKAEDFIIAHAVIG